MAVIFIKFFDVIPARFNLWVMLFTSCWMVYMLRVNMSLNLIAMVPQGTPRNTSSQSQCGSDDVITNITLHNESDPHVQAAPIKISGGASFNWSAEQQALILGSYFWCYPVTSLVGGMAAERWGPRYVVLTTTVASGVLTALSPIAARLNYIALVVIRFLLGFAGQALILGSYFWCYPVTSLVGGMAAERWGPRYVVLTTTVASGVLTALSPIAARLNYIALVVIRFLLGFAGGFIYPALHVLVARWAPPAEKGKFVSAMMGGTLGTVVTWSLTGPLMEKFGWASAFYVPAAITLVWCAFWWYLVADTPSDHPRITEAEKKYILDALGDKVKKSKGLPPFKSIVTSFPFLAMIILHYGNLWGLYFIMTVGPKFVSSVLGFELSAAGVISALPYLARLFLAAIFGVIGDFILARKLMSTTMIRKFFTVFSHILPGILLVLLVYAGCSTALSVALITMSMGFNGAATLTNLQNHQDLAPNYAGTLYGIANCVGSTAGFFTPMITAYFTSSGNSFESWRPVFFLGASVYIVSAVFFILFGTGNIQAWNFATEDKEGKEEKEGKINGDLKEMSSQTIKNGDTKEMKETTLNVTS